MIPKTSKPCIWNMTSISRLCCSTNLAQDCKATSCSPYSLSQRVRRSVRVNGRKPTSEGVGSDPVAFCSGIPAMREISNTSLFNLVDRLRSEAHHRCLRYRHRQRVVQSADISCRDTL